MPTDNRALLAEYQQEPRRIRRAVSRDLARANPIPPRASANQPDPRKPQPRRMRRERGTARSVTRRKMRRNVVHPIGKTGRPTSGQARINAKRNQRAEFWAERQRTVRVTVSTEMEPHFRQHLGLLGDRARIDGRTPLECSYAADLDVHIPGAPADAVKAIPTYANVLGQDGLLRPVLLSVDWVRADGSHFETPDLPALV